MRVAPRWRAERVGHITDIEAWVPLADGEEPKAAPVRVPEEDEQPVTGIVSPVTLEYEINAGIAATSYLRGLAEGKIIGGRAPSSDDVYAGAARAPTRRRANRLRSRSRSRTPVWSRRSASSTCPGLSELAPEIPYVSAQILLDGANTMLFGLIRGAGVDEVRMGMRVKAKWADELKPDRRSIKWFEPTGEPDADYELYKDYL